MSGFAIDPATWATLTDALLAHATRDGAQATLAALPKLDARSGDTEGIADVPPQPDLELLAPARQR